MERLEFRYFSNFAGILSIGGSWFLFRRGIFEMDQQHAPYSAGSAQIAESETAVLLKGWAGSAGSGRHAARSRP
jgi:hypothetical protein